jgi:3-oxoadipate enol-lactonase
MRVSRARLEEIRDEYLAEDLVITDDMLGRKENQAKQYFESGGMLPPPEVTALQETLAFGATANRFILPDGTSLAYELWGDRMGPQMLILSGIGMTLSKSIAPLKKALGQCCCLTFEHRGTGGSSMPTERWPPPSTVVFAEDALKLVSAAGWRSCHVVGISFGGLVAQELALLCPSVVERLVLMCTAAPGAASERATLDTLQAALALPDAERLQAMLLLADTRRDDEWLGSEGGKAASALLRRSDAASKALPGGEAGRQYQATARAKCELASQWQAGGRAGEHQTGEHTKLLAADDCPPGHQLGRAPPGEQLGPRCCVIAAVHDGICQPAYALKLVELLPGCAVCWFDSGHWPILALEHSADFDETLGDFLVRGAVSERQQLRSAAVAAEHVPNNDSCCSECALL